MAALTGAAGARYIVKATRPEGLGAGSGRGIARLAVALVEEVAVNGSSGARAVPARLVRAWWSIRRRSPAGGGRVAGRRSRWSSPGRRAAAGWRDRRRHRWCRRWIGGAERLRDVQAVQPGTSARALVTIVAGVNSGPAEARGAGKVRGVSSRIDVLCSSGPWSYSSLTLRRAGSFRRVLARRREPGDVFGGEQVEGRQGGVSCWRRPPPRP